MLKTNSASKRVVIVGGGFGGLHAAKILGRSSRVEVSLLDRKNHHLFQPLLYQVATASLNASDIGVPIRQILARYRNTQVHLDTVLSVDLAGRRVGTESDSHPFDYLILACGSTHSYFGRDEWEELAPGLKTIEQALEIRRRILLAYELAEKETDPVAQKRLLTFVIIGGGPTGVELAGAAAELAHFTVAREFRNIILNQTRIILVQGADRLLPTFHPALSRKAHEALEKKGVRVILDRRAEEITPRGVRVGSEFFETATVLWAAGVKPSPLNARLGLPLDKEGRVPVNADLSVPGHPEVFVLGDQAHFEAPGGPLPGLAPVAMQQGDAAARNILNDLEGSPRKPFRYRDKGTMAVIGRGNAVSQIGFLRLTGMPAWLIWIFVHILYLVGHRNRIMVLLNWAWSYITFRGGARLITGRTWKENAPKAQPPVEDPALVGN